MISKEINPHVGAWKALSFLLCLLFVVATSIAVLLGYEAGRLHTAAVWSASVYALGFLLGIDYARELRL